MMRAQSVHNRDENDSDGVVLVQWKGKSRNKKKSHGLFTFAPVNRPLSER